jgi:thiamine pyrophosphate-dependent acetolactate synthase large subunit-like protein
MNGADVIAQILKREGTEFLACYPRNAVIDACATVDIRPILCRQERVGVGMADGFSRIRHGKQNGVFAAQHGPGIENAFPGIAQAFSLLVGGNYSKVAEGLNVASRRVEKPADIPAAIKAAVDTTEKGAPFLLEFMVKEGHDFSNYPY